MIHHFTRATRILIFWTIIVVAIASVSFRLFLAGVEDYKTELEKKFHDLTDIQLQIGSLKTGFRGFNPEIILMDIDILSVDEAGKPAVQLQQMRVGIDILQLLISQDFISSSWITLVGAKVAVVREEDGSFNIIGLNSGKDEPLWIFKGGKYEILQSEISWLDKKGQGTEVTFKQFDLLLNNDSENHNHEIHILSDLPDQYGDSLRISANIQGDIFAADHLSGSLYLEGKNVHFAKLINTDLPQQIKLKSGQGSFKLWSDWQDSKLNSVSGFIQSQNINIKRDNKSLTLDKLEGGVAWHSQDNGWRISTYQLNVESSQFKWQNNQFCVASGSNEQFSAVIKKLDLQGILQLAPFFLTQEMESQIPADLDLEGTLRDFTFYLDSSDENHAVNGYFSDLSTVSKKAFPELKGLSGHLSGTPQQGVINLDAKMGSLFFADYFRNPIAFENASGAISWYQNDDFWQLNSDSIKLDTVDFDIHSRMDISLPKSEDPIHLDLQIGFEGIDAANRVPSYLPAKIMGQETVEWLDNAFISGSIRNGGLILSGDMNEFPFTKGQGKFEASFEMDNGTLLYHSDWPQLENLEAEVQFLANSLQVKIRHAQSEKIDIRQAVIDIPDLKKSKTLLVDGALSGKINDGLLLMQKTPHHAVFDTVVESIDFSGSSKVDLNLKIPLFETVDPEVDGVIYLNNAGLKVKQVSLPVEKVSGELHFTEQGLFSQGLDSIVLGFPAQLKIDTIQASTLITVTGNSSIEKLQQQFSFLQNDFAKGSFEYTTVLDLPKEEVNPATLAISSDLRGVTINLPGALKKSANQQKPVNFQLGWSEAINMPVNINYNDHLKLALLVNKEQESLHSGHIVYGQGQAETVNSAGFFLDINQPLFSISEWIGLLDGDKSEPSLPALKKVNINTEQLVWDGFKLGKLELAIRRMKKNWQGSLSSSVAKGAIRVPFESDSDEKIVLQMTHLDLNQLAEIELPDSASNSKKLPLIDIFSEKLWWRERDIGRLELQSKRLLNGIHFNKIKVTGRNNFLDMKADWTRSGAINRTALKGTLASPDFGGLLNEFGFGDDLKKTSAKIAFSGDWDGAPYQFSLAGVQGQMDIQMQDGSISSIEPGFGRLLGLVAMEQWVKRFTLDFSDIYKKGLAFNNITGNFSINAGKAVTDDLLLDAIAARVKITGEADLINKTLDHKVWVVPKSSAAVPIAGTIVGGIASVVTKVFTDDYKEGYFFGSGYKIEGKWGSVEITPLHDKDGLLKKTWSGLTDFPWLKKPRK